MKNHSTKRPLSNVHVGRAAAALALFTAGACASVDHINPWSDDGPEPVERAMLQYADDDARSDIREARIARADARDRLTNARAALDDAEEMHEIACEQLDIAEERLDLAEDRLDGADRNRIVEASTRTKREATDEIELAKQRIAIYDRMIETREAEIDVAEAEVALADARVQLQMAEAASVLERKGADEIDVDEHRAWVRSRETEVEVAKARHSAALREFEIEREAFEGDAARFPEMQTEFEKMSAKRASIEGK